MQLVKPAWVVHKGKTKDGQPIFSIDIHPDGSRFATGGQVDDSGKIIIWNMAPVRSEIDSKNNDVPKILCEMDNHLGCVNCVRWSGNGKFLASGGDDKLVIIWQTSKYGVGSTVFGSDSKIIESWRPVHTLRGHSGDVLDLAWSPDDVWLATCSIDNTVIVWNAENLPEQQAVLKGHTGLVKGVTWDPVGKYLASQSDDKTLRIWRTRDWQEEVAVTEPFKECGGTTHVLRCDWSPDGHYVVSAHAMNNSAPTAQIIERDGWKTTLDFVGHRKATTVVRFNPNILSKVLKKDAVKPTQYTCCAIGSRDRSLSIWLTALKRPLVVTHDLFTNSILDISWAQTGTELLCCSCDGTVAYLRFKPGEIGTPLDRDDVNLLLEKIYGKRSLKNNANSSANQIIESADILKLQQDQKKQQNGSAVSPPLNKTRHASNSSSLSTPSKYYKGVDISNSPFKPTDKQIETKTADGRRRITPIFISPQPEAGDAPAPYSSQINFTTSKIGSTIQVEKQDKVTHSGLLSPSTPKTDSSSNQGKTPSEASQKSVSPSGTIKVNVEQTKFNDVVQVEKQDKVTHSGLLSLTTPKTDSSSNQGKTPSEASQKSVSPSGTIKVNVEQAKFSDVVQPIAALDSKVDSPSVAKSKGSPEKQSDSDKIKSKSSTLQIKRKLDKDHDDQPKKRGRPKQLEKEKPKSTPNSTPSIPHHATERETVRYVQTSSDVNLPVPEVGNVFNTTISRETGTEPLMLEVENYVQGGNMSLHKLKCTQAGNVIWEQVLSSKILAVAGSRRTSCVACSDGTLSIFNPMGQKIMPSIQLSSKIFVLDVKDYYVMAITSKGSLNVWNIQKKEVIIKNEQLSTLVKSDITISQAFITQEGIPIVTLSNTKSFSYATDMGCWHLIHDKSDHIHLCSAHQNSKPRMASKVSGTLTNLQMAQERSGTMAQRSFQSGTNLKLLSTLNHLQSQVQICLKLKSPSEYKFWLQTYVRYLVQEGLESHLRELCSDLLGPLYQSKSSVKWESTILGMNKRELLKEILPYFGENLKTLQRLYTEFQEQLDSIDCVT